MRDAADVAAQRLVEFRQCGFRVAGELQRIPQVAQYVRLVGKRIQRCLQQFDAFLHVVALKLGYAQHGQGFCVMRFGLQDVAIGGFCAIEISGLVQRNCAGKCLIDFVRCH